MVTVRPNFQDSVHVGYVAGLRKFAEYFTSVLCFTTPGDGPRSPPQLVRTHEDGTGRLRGPGGWERPRAGALGPAGAAGGDAERCAAQPRETPAKGSPLHAPSWWGSCGCRGLLLLGAQLGAELGVFGQCLAPWDISASVTSWTRP